MMARAPDIAAFGGDVFNCDPNPPAPPYDSLDPFPSSQPFTASSSPLGPPPTTVCFTYLLVTAHLGPCTFLIGLLQSLILL
jgi:hypothetical protein